MQISLIFESDINKIVVSLRLAHFIYLKTILKFMQSSFIFKL